MAFCGECGNEIKDKAAICTKCGVATGLKPVSKTNKESLNKGSLNERLIKFGLFSIIVYVANIILGTIIFSLMWGDLYFFGPGGFFDLGKLSILFIPTLFIQRPFSLWHLREIFNLPGVAIPSLFLFLLGLAINFLLSSKLTIFDSIIKSRSGSNT